MKKAVKAKSPKHEWLKSREAEGAYVVINLSAYAQTPHARGQFYPLITLSSKEIGGHAVWPSHEKAMAAAKWAARAHPECKYGIFKLGEIVETVTPPCRVVKI